MSAASNYLEKKLLDHVLMQATYTQPSGLWIGLFKSTVDGATTLANLEAGTISDEVSGGDYARKTVSFAAANSTTGVAATSATITFNEATANWGDITHVAIMDAATGGNVLFYGAVTTPKTIEIGDTFQITTGSLTITLS